MKNTKDLFELIAQATEENSREFKCWFFNYSGHVNEMTISFYFSGWEKDRENHSETIRQKLNEEGIQVLYWFIKTRLN
jgi:hypothetical protein